MIIDQQHARLPKRLLRFLRTAPYCPRLWDRLLPPESHEALGQLMTTLLSTGALPPFEWELLRKDGSRVPILAMATLLDQERRLALGVTLDTTEQKAAERRKQEFLRMVSHELRTPLTAILGLIELALLHIKRCPTSLAPEAEGLLGHCCVPPSGLFSSHILSPLRNAAVG